MKKLFCFLTLVSCFYTAFAKTEPVKGVEPSQTLPILYINTENGQEIDQKETYINGEWWLETYGRDEFEPIGSSIEPQKLGIRGRGNTSWLHDGQKPYKLKLDKKNSLLGMGKNKHWALLTCRKRWELYNGLLAFEMGRQLGMKFVPEMQPVEVVLNGTYMGLYMLTETIRIDDNRLEIYEQPELNEDPETIGDGWLVEIDNNTEENQVAIPQPQGYNLRVTHHTPEIVNDLQRDWLTDQMTQITQAINFENKLDTDWEELVDVDALIKHLIVEESITNYDAYLGSCYMHKDTGEKWTFGPLWDFSSSGFGFKTGLITTREDQHWIGEFYKFPRFRKRLKEMWDEYYSRGTDWMRPFLTEFYEKIRYAVERSVQVWPDTPLDAENGVEVLLASVPFDMDFNDKVFASDCLTYDISYELAADSSVCEEEENSPIVKFNGLEKNNVTVISGDNVTLTIDCNKDIVITKILKNGEELFLTTSQHVDIPLDNIREDLALDIHYKDMRANAGVTEIENDMMDGNKHSGIFDLTGRRYKSKDNLSPGLYIINGKKTLIK